MESFDVLIFIWIILTYIFFTFWIPGPLHKSEKKKSSEHGNQNDRLEPRMLTQNWFGKICKESRDIFVSNTTKVEVVLWLSWVITHHLFGISNHVEYVHLRYGQASLFCLKSVCQYSILIPWGQYQQSSVDSPSTTNLLYHIKKFIFSAQSCELQIERTQQNQEKLCFCFLNWYELHY